MSLWLLHREGATPFKHGILNKCGFWFKCFKNYLGMGIQVFRNRKSSQTNANSHYSIILILDWSQTNAPLKNRPELSEHFGSFPTGRAVAKLQWRVLITISWCNNWRSTRAISWLDDKNRKSFVYFDEDLPKLHFVFCWSWKSLFNNNAFLCGISCFVVLWYTVELM